METPVTCADSYQQRSRTFGCSEPTHQEIVTKYSSVIICNRPGFWGNLLLRSGLWCDGRALFSLACGTSFGFFFKKKQKGWLIDLRSACLSWDCFFHYISPSAENNLSSETWPYYWENMRPWNHFLLSHHGALDAMTTFQQMRCGQLIYMPILLANKYNNSCGERLDHIWCCFCH